MQTGTAAEAGGQILLRYLGRYGRPLGVAGGLAAGRAVLDLARPWPLLLAVDHAIGRRPLGQPWATLLAPVAGSPVGLAAVAGLALVGLAAVSGIAGSLSEHLADAGAERIGADLRADVHDRLLRLSPRFHQRQRTGDLATLLTDDVGRVQDALVAWLATLAPQLTTLAGTTVVLLAIDPVMALVSLAVATSLAMVVADRRQHLRTAQLDHRRRQGVLAASVSEAMRNIRVTQALARERLVQRTFGGHNLAVVRAGLDVADLNARHRPAADVVLAMGAALVLWVAVARVMGGRMTVGLLVVVLWYVTALHAPVRSLSRLSSILGAGAAGGERLVEVLASPETVPEHPGARVLAAPRREIRFRGVSFAYGPGRRALFEVDLAVPAGSTLCVVGPIGAGKTTLLSLLLRLHDPDSGRIEFDGADLATFDLSSVRDRIALVPHDPAIFDGSLLDNIAAGRKGASEAELREAGRRALLDDFVRALPSGYRTQVGEGGLRLSSGQRRCLAVARTLVRQAPVMLLDEPTSDLDPESEGRVMDAIRAAGAGRTVVMVTCRPALAARAESVAVLCGGRVVEHGAPGQLLGAGGHYARLWSLHEEADSPRRRKPCL